MTVTKQQIADYLGISRSAVSIALNDTPGGTLAQKTREKIWQAARELGYKETAATPKVAYILHGREADDPRYLSNLRVAEEMAAAHGYAMLLKSVRDIAQHPAVLSDFVQMYNVSGVIVTGVLNDALIDQATQLNIPTLFYGFTERRDLPAMVPDFEQVAYKAVNYLISLGHEKIALFAGRLYAVLMRGYRRALEEAGLPIDKSLIQISMEENGYEMSARAQLLELAFTAAFCGNNIIHFGVLQHLKEQGRAVPGEISLISHGCSELARASVPNLTGMYLSNSGIEQTVVRLIDLIDGKGTERQTVLLSDFAFYPGGTAGTPFKASGNS